MAKKLLCTYAGEECLGVDCPALERQEEEVRKMEFARSLVIRSYPDYRTIECSEIADGFVNFVILEDSEL